MSKSWYYQHDDQIQGPYSLDEMKRLASEGMLDPSALILQLGEAPEQAKTARDVLGATCFSGELADALLSAGIEQPVPPRNLTPPKKDAKTERRPKVTLRIRKKSKRPKAPPTPPMPIAELEPVRPEPIEPPLAIPVEEPQFGDVPLAEPIAEAAPVIDPLDYLIGDRKPVKKPKRIEPERINRPRPPTPTPARPVATPRPPVARPVAPKARPTPPKAYPAPTTPEPVPQIPFMDAFRKARFLVDDWLDGDDHRDIVRTGDVELIRSQPEIDAIFTRYESYGPAFDEKLRQHLTFTTENRARYYNARPNG